MMTLLAVIPNPTSPWWEARFITRRKPPAVDIPPELMPPGCCVGGARLHNSLLGMRPGTLTLVTSKSGVGRVRTQWERAYYQTVKDTGSRKPRFPASQRLHPEQSEVSMPGSVKNCSFADRRRLRGTICGLSRKNRLTASSKQQTAEPHRLVALRSRWWLGTMQFLISRQG